MPALNDLHRKYRDRAAFLLVYIREAHPEDAWQLPVNVRESVVFAQPRTYEERCRIAEQCFSKLGVEFPAYVDDMADSVEKAYTAWPDRLYVVDRDGRIAHKSGPGPYGFQPKGVADALARLVPEAAAPLSR